MQADDEAGRAPRAQRLPAGEADADPDAPARCTKRRKGAESKNTEAQTQPLLEPRGSDDEGAATAVGKALAGCRR